MAKGCAVRLADFRTWLRSWPYRCADALPIWAPAFDEPLDVIRANRENRPSTPSRPTHRVPPMRPQRLATLLLSLLPVSGAVLAADCKPPDGKPLLNRLQWTTASEQNSFAFEVFRSDSEAGEAARITATPILAAG